MQSAGHRSHDYAFLVRRWKKAAKAAGVALDLLAEADGLPVYVLRTRTLTAHGGYYLSAGIHGDEPASTEGLITWAEQYPERLRQLPLLIFPCLNPWGLANNIRLDRGRRDLNRIFHQPRRSAVIRAWYRAVAGHTFAFCQLMHEDYDAIGCYVYEIRSILPHWGERMLEAARLASSIGPDPRTRIEGWPAVAGVVRRRIPRGTLPGMPEALALFFNGYSKRVFTFETPSEFCLEKRNVAQVAALDSLFALGGVKP